MVIYPEKDVSGPEWDPSTHTRKPKKIYGCVLERKSCRDFHDHGNAVRSEFISG